MWVERVGWSDLGKDLDVRLEVWIQEDGEVVSLVVPGDDIGSLDL
jgi:hypothetical protein